MNRHDRVQTVNAQAGEMREALHHMSEQEGETPTTAAITKLALLSVALADVTVSILRLSMASMGKKETKVGELCKELGITAKPSTGTSHQKETSGPTGLSSW